MPDSKSRSFSTAAWKQYNEDIEKAVSAYSLPYTPHRVNKIISIEPDSPCLVLFIKRCRKREASSPCCADCPRLFHSPTSGQPSPKSVYCCRSLRSSNAKMRLSSVKSFIWLIAIAFNLANRSACDIPSWINKAFRFSKLDRQTS